MNNTKHISLYIFLVLSAYNLFSKNSNTYAQSKLSLYNKADNSSISFIKDKQGYFTYIRQNANSTIIYTTDSITGDIIDSTILDDGYVSKNLFRFELKKGYIYFTVLYNNELVYHSIYCSAKTNKKYHCFDYLSKETILKADTAIKGQTISLDTNTKCIKVQGKCIPVYAVLVYESGGSEGKKYDLYKKIFYRKSDLIPIQIEYCRNSFNDIPYSKYQIE